MNKNKRLKKEQCNVKPDQKKKNVYMCFMEAAKTIS